MAEGVRFASLSSQDIANWWMTNKPGGEGGVGWYCPPTAKFMGVSCLGKFVSADFKNRC